MTGRPAHRRPSARLKTRTTITSKRRKRADDSGSDRPKSVRARLSGSLVYGEYDGQLVFIPEPRARYLAQVWEAMVTSTTWGELKRLAPASAYRKIRACNNDRDPAELRPDAPFYYGDMMPSVYDGDYPGWPAQEMLRWMPRDIRRDFGGVDSSWVSGEFLTLELKSTRAIVQRLTQAAFRCRRNQRLVERACGD